MKTRGRVFLLDDDDLIVSMLARARKGEGYEVQAETDPDGIIDKIRPFAPDVVMLDLKLPGASGMEILKEITDRGIGTQVVMLTSDDSAESAGAAYVFTRAGTRWSQQAYIKAWNADPGDFFGHEVALSADGRTLAVGAHGEGSSATGIGGDQSDNSIAGAGAVYVFTRTIEGWVPEAYIKANTSDRNSFGGGFPGGGALALSAVGSRLAVGAPTDEALPTRPGGVGLPDRPYRVGAAYVFTRSGTAWSQEAYLKASNAAFANYFGTALAMSADGATLAVSSLYEGSRATGVDGDQLNVDADESGATYVFTRVGARWSQQAYVKASNTGAGDWFGVAMALSADGAMLAVGAMEEDSRAKFGDDDQFDDSMTEAGAVYVFVRSGGRWSQSDYIKAPNTGTLHWFGFSVALSDDAATLAVGAPGEGSDEVGVDGDHMFDGAPLSGAAYVY